jgi:hypothetical protein
MVKMTTLLESEVRELREWLAMAESTNNPIELHVVGQGWEFRCEGLKPCLIRPEGY